MGKVARAKRPSKGLNTIELAKATSLVKGFEKKSILEQIQIGCVVQRVFDQHDGFMRWVREDLKWSHGTSLNYRNLYALSLSRNHYDFSKLDITQTALYYAAACAAREDEEPCCRLFCDAILEAAKTKRVSYQVANEIVVRLVQAEEAEAKEVEAKRRKLVDDYGERFGFVSGNQDDWIYPLMKAALKSGVDEPKLVERKREQAEHEAEFDRKQAEFQATPITAETEQEYTGLIKQRRLYEGACMLAWEQYFKFRAQHPDCEPLTPDDLAYAGQWTSCANAGLPTDTRTPLPNIVTKHLPPTVADPNSFKVKTIRSSVANPVYVKAKGSAPNDNDQGAAEESLDPSSSFDGMSEEDYEHYEQVAEPLRTLVDVGADDVAWSAIIQDLGLERIRKIAEMLLTVCAQHRGNVTKTEKRLLN
jgi:hypothetical protein